MGNKVYSMLIEAEKDTMPCMIGTRRMADLSEPGFEGDVQVNHVLFNRKNTYRTWKASRRSQYK